MENYTQFKNLRYEKKFFLTGIDLLEAESFIKENSAMFSEIFSQRTVNNIYLDSKSLKNFLDSVDGNSQRSKARIRWYGNTFGKIENPVLELKTKSNELGKKMRFPLSSFYLEKGFSHKTLQEVFLKSKLPQEITGELKLTAPTLLNTYKRKYYLSANKKQRITLDWNLVFFRITDSENKFSEKISDNGIVLEFKYSLKDYKETANIISELPFRFVAHSKYVKGINLLNL